MAQTTLSSATALRRYDSEPVIPYCLVTIGPGISGQPGSPFYGNLLDDWVNGAFFPLAYTRPMVESVTKYKLVLRPAR